MAQPLSTFVEYFAEENDPYHPLGAVLTNFSPLSGQTPAELYASCSSAAYPLPLLVAGENHRPIFLLAPFAIDALPGSVEPPRKFGFIGDISARGQVPGLLEIANAIFHRTGNVTVLERGDVMAAFQALPQGGVILQVPGAAAAAVGGQAQVGPATHDIETRRAMPIPHEFAAAILVEYNTGTLTWEWLWTNVAVPTLADAAKAAAYELFLDFLQVSSMNRAGANVGDPARSPATEMDHGAGIVTPDIRDKALRVAEGFLPGLRPPVGVTAQLHQVQLQQTRLATQITEGQRHRAKTLQRDKPDIYATVLRICEVAGEVDVAPYWSMHPSIDSKSWLPKMEQTARTVAQEQTPPLTVPLFSPSFAQDVANGNLVSTNVHPGRGLSPFRVLPENAPGSEELQNCNRLYVASLQGTGPVGDRAIEMVMDNTTYFLPAGIEEFRGLLEAYYVTLVTFLGEHNRAVQEFKVEVIDHLNSIVTKINTQYRTEQHVAIFAKIMTWCYLMINDYLSQLLASAVPVATGTPAVGAPNRPPNFAKVEEKLTEGTIMTITELHPALYQGVLQESEPRPPPMLPGPAEMNPRRRGREGDTEGNRQVKRPNQNPRLKNGWRTSGHQTIFMPGSPFHDPNAADGKKLVPADESGKYLCIPMGVRGICYQGCTKKHDTFSRGEEDRVAAAGGFQLEA